MNLYAVHLVKSYTGLSPSRRIYSRERHDICVFVARTHADVASTYCGKVVRQVLVGESNLQERPTQIVSRWGKKEYEKSLFVHESDPLECALYSDRFVRQDLLPRLARHQGDGATALDFDNEFRGFKFDPEFLLVYLRCMICGTVRPCACKQAVAVIQPPPEPEPVSAPKDTTSTGLDVPAREDWRTPRMSPEDLARIACQFSSEAWLQIYEARPYGQYLAPGCWRTLRHHTLDDDVQDGVHWADAEPES